AAKHRFRHLEFFPEQPVLLGDLPQAGGLNSGFIALLDVDHTDGVLAAADRLANHAVYGVPHQRTDLVLFPAEEREHGPIRLDGAVADQPAQDPAEFKRALGAKAAA